MQLLTTICVTKILLKQRPTPLHTHQEDVFEQVDVSVCTLQAIKQGFAPHILSHLLIICSLLQEKDTTLSKMHMS